MSSFREGAQTLGVLTKAVPAWEVETLVISRWREQKGTAEQLTCWKFKKTRRIPTFSYTLLYCRASSASEEDTQKIRREMRKRI